MNEGMEVCKWQYLQSDCLVKIFEKVEIEAMLQAVPFVCKSWYKTSLDPFCWTRLSFSPEMSTKQIKMVVDRSSGTALEVVFGPGLRLELDDFIYISERCPKLNVVSLPKSMIRDSCSCESFCDCKEKDGKIVASMVGNWKNLQHLIIDTGFYFEEIITEVATYCKNLEILEIGREYLPISLEEVSLITCSLPKIKRLILRKDVDISRECLLSLLSGCKELTRVDVRECFGFDKDDEEILKMASHVKVFMADGSKPHSPFQESINEMFNEEIDLSEILGIANDIAEI